MHPHLAFGTGEQSWQPSAGTHAVRAEQRVAEAVERRRGRLRHGPAQPGRDPAPKLVRGLAAERQHEHLVRRRAALDPGYDRLDQRGRLAGARTGQHQ